MMPIRISLKGIEERIEDAIMADPGALGYPDALAIRNCRVPSVVGCPDVILLPKTGLHRIVLIEAKAARAKDAAAQVVGQLLMYYTGALTVGREGLALYVDFAEKQIERARDPRRTSIAALSGFRHRQVTGVDPLVQGTLRRPDEIAMFIAMDEPPHASLLPTLHALKLHHRLEVALVVVQNGRIQMLAGR